MCPLCNFIFKTLRVLCSVTRFLHKNISSKKDVLYVLMEILKSKSLTAVLINLDCY